jgi:hypothetical protein
MSTTGVRGSIMGVQGSIRGIQGSTRGVRESRLFPLEQPSKIGPVRFDFRKNTN